ncbi:hypothetical protein [Leptolyngbya sp. KIOST-1]|uniref:hypothetical protein n=1 Tax=Leptolyngbya sp. KIOST-1 TaxID=1229172 RepID=UPI00056D79A2|nr:hypothetical protein [Leptolyngbya sp. KIOST-1]
MDGKDWARYIEATDGLSKPWLLIQWRLQLLQEQRPHLDPETYATELAALHQALMDLGEWWQGQEERVFGSGESLPGDS